MIQTLNEQRFGRMIDIIDSTEREMPKAHRVKLMAALMREVERAAADGISEAEFYIRLWENPPLWVLAFIDDEHGLPMFMSPWQCRFWAMFHKKRRLMGLTARKAGKSTCLAAILTWALCAPHPIRAVAFSPTESQSFIYDKCRTYVLKSEYLRDTFISGSDSKDSDYEMRSGIGSVIYKGYVSLNTKGEQSRGQYGDIIIVDEIQSISKSILDEIIEPMVADSFSIDGMKKLIYIGTPHTKANPELPNMWDRYRKKSLTTDSYGTFSIDCWGAIEEGCLDEEYVLEQEATLPPDVFAREYLAVFPDTSDGFIGKQQIMRCVKHDLRFQTPRANSAAEYAMSTDWAKQKDRTQILVGRIDRGKNTITYVDWLEIDSESANNDYTYQAEQALRLFHAWGCRWYIPDASGTQDMMLDTMRNGVNGQKGIPDYKIWGYKNGVPDDKQKLGYRATRESNFNMYINHRQLLIAGQIVIPGEGKRERQFIKRYVKEHTGLISVETASGMKFEKPKGGTKDLVSAASMMSLLVRKKPTTPPSASIASFGPKRKPLSAGWLR